MRRGNNYSGARWAFSSSSRNQLSQCVECGHLHHIGWVRGEYRGYAPCPLEGCGCKGHE